MKLSSRLLIQAAQIRDAARAVVGFSRERLESGLVFNPTRPDLRVDPYPYYRQLRDKNPIHRSYAANGWVLSRYDDVLEVLSDKSFSSDERHMAGYPRMLRKRLRAGLPDMYEGGMSSMLRLDPPDHTRLRSLVSKAFTPRQVERMRPRILSLLDELLGGYKPGNKLDLIREFAAPLPVIVIAEMLGVPSSDRDRFHAWSEEAVRTLGGSTLEDQRRSWEAMSEMGEYFEEQIEERRRNPCGDLLSDLAAAEEEGDRLTNEELFTTLVLLLVAGNETTTKLIGNSVLALLGHPEEAEALRKNPERIPGAIDELLRFDSPVQMTSRMVTEDREFRGHKLRKGQQMILLLGAANRDPARFEAPDSLQVDRDAARHLSFSHGLHFCLGAGLARLEGALAIEALLLRFPEMRIAGNVKWGDNTVLRGPLEVPLTL